MRRQSYCSNLSGTGEPLIVVEESTLCEEDLERRRNESPPRCLDPDSPSLNPYLLSPWREARKHSLPTPQCTSGITASQVRRLSERGGERSGPSAREAAFLATLSQAPAPQPGGRRHSVVTISKVPPTLFGRNRRESIAAFPLGVPRVLGASRRDSVSGSNSGSTHNLQLDIMDDIAEIKAARKVRLKMWKTPSRERVCEVQSLEGNGSSTQRYTQQQQQQRRFSDFSLALAASSSSGAASTSTMKRRASEIHRPGAKSSATTPTSGIVCSNTDLISILSTLTSSATEINRCGCEEPTSTTSSSSREGWASKTVEQKRNKLKSFRSNSFDVSILHGTGNKTGGGSAGGSGKASGSGTGTAPSNWFVKRHQPMWKKQKSGEEASSSSPSSSNVLPLSFKFDKSKVVKAVREGLTKTTVVSPTRDPETRHKVVWDGISGTKVDAQVLGSAIEVFLTSQRGNEADAPAGTGSSGSSASGVVKTPAVSPGKSSNSKVASWFSSKNKEDEQTESCEASICSSLKDLFVK